MVQSQNSPSPQQAGTALRSGLRALPPRATTPGLQGALRPPRGLRGRGSQVRSLVLGDPRRARPKCACSGLLLSPPPPRPPGNLEDSRLAERMAEWGFCSHLFQAGSVPDFCEQVEVPLPHTHPGASDHTPSPLGRQRGCHTRAQSSLEAYSPQAVFQS